MKRSFILSLFLMVSIIPSSFAGEVDVIDSKIQRTAKGLYNISVTLKHADTGWEHYANKWEVRGVDGTIYATRILHHPHVNEQPFTRSLSGVKIPEEATHIIIRGYDSVHDYGGKELKMEVKR